MLITIGLFLEFRPSLHIFSSDAILRIGKTEIVVLVYSHFHEWRLYFLDRAKGWPNLLFY